MKEFLSQTFWDISYLNWILFAFFIFLSLLFKKVISTQLAHFVIFLTKKFGNQYSADLFKRLLIKPLRGLVTTLLLFMAVTRLLPKIDTLIVFSGLNRAPKGQGDNVALKLNEISVFDILYTIYLIFFIYYTFFLIVKVIDLVISIRLRKALEQQDRGRQQILPLMKDIFRVLVWMIGIIVLLGVVFNVNVTALFAGLGIGGVALAFAAKESIENLIASFMVLVDKPFTIGDWIKVEGIEGIIEKVGFRSSRLRTFDKSLIIIPNRKLIDSNVENFSERGLRRVSQVVGSVYGVSQNSIKEFIEDFKNNIKKIEGVLPNASVSFDGFGQSQLDFVIVYFVQVGPNVDFSNVKQNVNLLIYRKMYKHFGGFALPAQVQLEGKELNEVHID